MSQIVILFHHQVEVWCDFAFFMRKILKSQNLYVEAAELEVNRSKLNAVFEMRSSFIFRQDFVE
ncbi:hypothetical protein ACFFIF_06835 [Vagococcus entomophilus]|uniref:Uncharacterized protein n=1 Tax=Vagococcus entomophilus TaxID=1160095 RepID=A0A430AFL8_9ENTE|nr:hypothetical protein [Vagococcus entomophilus]RSU06537.1 hypothetical protein CBF30_09830 [Vagococcus entomophilus]